MRDSNKGLTASRAGDIYLAKFKQLQKEQLGCIYLKGFQQGYGIRKTSVYEYEGDLVDEKFDGYGKLTKYLDKQGDKTVYTGQWKNHKKHGFGKYEQLGSENPNYVYVGSFVDGGMTGQGTCIDSKGSFSGEWLNG